MCRQWALRGDSGGPGRHRGGLGAVYEIELLEQSADAFLFGERGRHAPAGVVGGDHAALNRFTYPAGPEGGEAHPPMASKMVGIKLVQGQSVLLETPGGGGYGPAAERDPAEVAEDVRLGYVSPTAARDRYLVAVAEDGTLDQDATQELRAGEAA